ARAAGTGRAEVDGEGALVPAFDARIAARMAQELFSEMAAGKEAGRVSSRAQASLVRAKFRSTLARSRGAAPPASLSDLADRTLTSFDETDLELALQAGQLTADQLKIKNPTTTPASASTTKTKPTTAATTRNKKNKKSRHVADKKTAAAAGTPKHSAGPPTLASSSSSSSSGDPPSVITTTTTKNARGKERGSADVGKNKTKG
ncbi:unnamed protein product, partial [Ectocarpus sp. 6 AP-2014]